LPGKIFSIQSGILQGTVFIPFHFAEAAANILILDVRALQVKIPDYKVCTVAIKKR